MPRYRTIKPTYWSDAKVCRLSLEAELLFIGLWNFADDNGLLWDDPDQIQMDIFPSRPHIKVASLIEELLLSGMVRSVDTTIGRHALHVVHFEAHQKIDHPTMSAIAALLVTPLDSSCGVDPEGKGREGKGVERKNLSSPAEQDDRFEDFWKLYPPRNGKKLDKAKALASWKRLSQAKCDRALRGVVHYRAACDAGTYAKDAYRWLRDEAFDDWQTPGSSNGTAPKQSTLEPISGAGRTDRGWQVGHETQEEWQARIGHA